MAEDRESSDRKHEKSKKRDRLLLMSNLIWTKEEKLQLAEAIDMYGTINVAKLASCIRNKTRNQVALMLRQLRICNHKEIECLETKPKFVDLNTIDDLFVAGGPKPKDVMIKWFEYLESAYDNDPHQHSKFKLLSNSFLVMSECMPTVTDKTEQNDSAIDFRKVYYYLYRSFNNYFISKQHTDCNMNKYLHDMFLSVLEEIEYTSDIEKIAMYNIVSKWTSVNRLKNLRVYGKTNKTEKTELEDIKPTLKKTEIRIVERPTIPSFNPLRMESTSM